MKLDKQGKIVLTVFLIKNVVSVVCFTVLAIHFHKWWIILFALLFLSEIKTSTYMTCDGCGRHTPHASTHGRAIEKGRKLGWVRYKNPIKDKWEDYCPECVEKGKVPHE